MESVITARVPFVLVNGTILFLLLMVPYGDLLTRMEIHRFCTRHGLKVEKIRVTKRTFGVDYLHNGESQHGRWPEDFAKFKGDIST